MLCDWSDSKLSQRSLKCFHCNILLLSNLFIQYNNTYLCIYIAINLNDNLKYFCRLSDCTLHINSLYPLCPRIFGGNKTVTVSNCNILVSRENACSHLATRCCRLPGLPRARIFVLTYASHSSWDAYSG